MFNSVEFVNYLLYNFTGIRKNRKEISIPSIMKPLIALNNMLPYRIRIILMDFFNFGHRGWFSFC